MILAGQCRDALAVTVCLSGRPGKFWRGRSGLNKISEGDRIRETVDDVSHHVSCGVDLRDSMVRIGCNVDLFSIRTYRYTKRMIADGDRCADGIRRRIND